MRKCWYCGKEIKNETDKEHIGICCKCYNDRFEVDSKLVRELIKYQTDKDQKIDDLKTKLADIEKKYEDRKQFCISETRSQMVIINNLLEENEELKQQLAEKDKIIENLKIDLKDWQELEEKLGTKYDKVVEQLANKEKEIIDYVKIVDDLYMRLSDKCDFCEDSVAQAKTDFAIEKLEKVKELCIKDMTICEDYFAIEKILDKQIKKLKEKTNENR